MSTLSEFVSVWTSAIRNTFESLGINDVAKSRKRCMRLVKSGSSGCGLLPRDVFSRTVARMTIASRNLEYNQLEYLPGEEDIGLLLDCRKRAFLDDVIRVPETRQRPHYWFAAWGYSNNASYRR